MRKSLASGVGVAAALVVVFGAPTVAANPYDVYAGQTYAKVKEQTNGNVQISSRFGEYLQTDDCIVTASRRLAFKDSSGNGSRTFLVDLNCSDPNTAGHPGPSAASPEGKAAKALQQKAKNMSKNYANAVAEGSAPWCADRISRCQDVCRQSGACSAELLQYLGI